VLFQTSRIVSAIHPSALEAPMERRTVLRLAASGLALTALGGGAWLHRRRVAARRLSARIIGPWPALGAQTTWLLPELSDALMVVPDRPHAKGEDDSFELRRAVRRLREFRVSSGPARLRGEAFDPQPSPGTLRLLALGDSTTFGWGVEDGESWPAQLQGWLAAEGYAVEVLNGGVPGQSLVNIGAYLRHVVPTLGVHGILLGRRPWSPHEMTVYRDLMEEAGRLVPGVRRMVVLPPVGRFDPVGSRQWAQEREQLTQLLRPHGVSVLELTAPFRAAQGQRGCDLQLGDGVLRVVRLETNEVLLEAPPTPFDLPRAIYDLMERDHTVGEPLIFDAGHTDAEGNVLAARLLGRAIIAEGWLG
jgi:hypothetical protein